MKKDRLFWMAMSLIGIGLGGIATGTVGGCMIPRR